MATQYYETITVAGTASVEKLAALVSGTQASKKRVKRLFFTETTGTLQHDATIRAAVGTETIVDFWYPHFLLTNVSDNRVVNPGIELDLELDVGETLKVGVVSGATASDFKITAQYELVA